MLNEKKSRKSACHIKLKGKKTKQLDEYILKQCLSKMNGLVLVSLDQKPGIICSKHKDSFDLTFFLILSL